MIELFIILFCKLQFIKINCDSNESYYHFSFATNYFIIKVVVKKMKKFHSLVFYIKNNNSKIYLNSIISNYVEPICKCFNKKVDKVNLDIEILGEEIEKECDYNDYSVLNDFYIDSKSEQLQFLSFLSNEKTNDEPAFIIKFIFQYNKLEIRIDYEQKNISFEEYRDIVDIVNSNGMELRYSFIYDYNDNWNSVYLVGIETGIMTYKRRKLVNEIKHHNYEDFFNSIVHIFSLNYINVELLTKDMLNEIVNIVGEGNYYVYDKKGIIFKCSNYFIKRKINKLLKEC